MKRTLSLLLLVPLLGCSAEYWTGRTTMRTELRAPGWKFVDTKDNDISIAKASYDPNNGGVLEGLTIRNNASDPITAEIERIRAIGEVQRIQVEYFAQIRGMMTDIAGQLMPLIGGTRAAAAQQTEATCKIEELLAKLMARLPSPTSQPATQ
jgi:hypothetical protein